jgi:hypothetical protein
MFYNDLIENFKLISRNPMLFHGSKMQFFKLQCLDIGMLELCKFSCETELSDESLTSLTWVILALEST